MYYRRMNGVKKLKQLNLEYTIIFSKHGYKSLFGKIKPMYQKALTIDLFTNNELGYRIKLK